MSGASWPTVTSAALDPATVEAWFADLLALTTIDQVLVKGETGAYSGPAALDVARRALANGARGIQIRYRWQGQGWLDTLMQTPTGIRIVRIPQSQPVQELP